MSAEKTEEPGDSQKPQEESPLKKEAENRQKTSDEHSSPNENPEVLTTIDITELDPSNFNWLREAKTSREAKNIASRDVDENKNS